MISTRNLKELPDIEDLKQLCKAIAVLDAIICPEWEYRYYSYNSNWAAGEECATMRNGSGDEYLILFNQYGAIINGFAHEVKPWQISQAAIPAEFYEFIFGEPVHSLGTTFCIWKKYGEKDWQTGHNELKEEDTYGDGSQDLLFILDGKPDTYKQWAEEYYEETLTDEVPLPVIKQIYNGKPLTEKMVLTLNTDIEDWEALKADLEEIAYQYTF